MDKKVEKFKADYANINAHVNTFKKKLRDLKKEIKRLKREAKSISTAAEALYDRGLNTMYIKVEGCDIDWKPKFGGFDNMINNLEYIMCIDHTIQQAIGDGRE